MSSMLYGGHRHRSMAFAQLSPRRVRVCKSVADTSGGLEAIQRTLSGALGGQMTVGGVAGFATGYAVKRIGQLLLIVVGAELLVMQAMAQRGWIAVNWDLIQKELSPHVEKEGVERVFESIKYKMPFAGAFSAGCIAGLKWS